MENNSNNNTSLTKNIYDGIYFVLGIFYKKNNYQTNQTNQYKKYISQYNSVFQYKKLPHIYTNPKWDSEKKRLVFGSFEHELELAKKKPSITNINLLLAPFYYNPLNTQKNNIKKFPPVYKFLRWDSEKKRMVFNSYDYSLELKKNNPVNNNK